MAAESALGVAEMNWAALDLIADPHSLAEEESSFDSEGIPSAVYLEDTTAVSRLDNLSALLRRSLLKALQALPTLDAQVCFESEHLTLAVLSKRKQGFKSRVLHFRETLAGLRDPFSSAHSQQRHLFCRQVDAEATGLHDHT